MAKRIQRKRTPGWRMPADAIYVGRPTKWGTPFSEGDNCELVRQFRENCLTPSFTQQIIKELRGKDLACWCSLDEPCHADVLLEIANHD